MLQHVVNALVTGSVYVLIAIGLTMVYGLLRILHVAHAAVYTLGAFGGLLVFRAGGNLWLCLVAGGLLAGIAGVAVYAGIYQHVLERPRLVALIASVGVFVLAEAVYAQDFMFGTDRVLFTPSTGVPGIATPFVRLSGDQLAIIAATAALATGLLLAFRRSRLGLEWRTIAQDPPMAEVAGIRVRRSMALNFFIGSALAGVAGVLVGAFDGRVFATMGAVPSYKAFVVVVMGGLGSVRGAVVAGYLLGLLETLVIVWAGFLLPRDAIAFLILLGFLMFRPQGLFGAAA